MYILLHQLDHEHGFRTEHSSYAEAVAAKKEWESVTGRRGVILVKTSAGAPVPV